MLARMEWLNYHHLLYFWMTARHGSMAKASAELRLAPPTLSSQIRQLEASLGEALFVREGRRLVLTDVGRVVQGYAEDIFSRGREMLDVVKQRGGPAGLTLAVGVSDALPKLVAWRLLQPALSIGREVRVVCLDGRHDRLLAELALHELDVVLSDAPAAGGLHVRAFNHLLGECGVSFFAERALAGRLKGRFPRGLDQAPFVAPADGTALRHSLDAWFERHGVRPRIIGEIEDSALLKTFGQAGAGVFAAPSVVEREVLRQYQVRVIGRTADIRERYYAISAERRLKHPAVVAMTEAARGTFFGRAVAS
jgi:LysR family transcriptional regulator, transcriptional activator of nhaA